MIRAVLPSGVRCLIRARDAAPVVAMTLLVAGGSAAEAHEVNGASALLGRALLKGTQTKSALQVAEAAEDAGGGIEGATDQEYVELRVWGLARYWRALLNLLHDVTTVPRLSADEVERERAVLLAQIRGLEDQPFQVANRILSRALYGPRGYGLPASGDLETVARLTPALLREHFRDRFVPEAMVLAVSGAIDAAEVLDELGRLFGGLGAGGPLAAPERPPGKPVRERDGETCPTQQAHLLFGFLTPPIGHPDHVPVKVMNALLGNGMSSRLFRTLRDDQGLAYSVGSFCPTRRATGRVVVHIGTAPANLEAAEAGIRRELARLAEEPVPEEELARTRAYLVGAFTLDRRTNARQSFHLGFYELCGVGAEYADRYPTLVEAITPAEVLRVARRYLVDPAIVTVGPAP